MNSKRTPRTFQVYVIRLRNSVWKRSRRYRNANPQYREGRPHVYVGSTGLTPEERFAKHKAGGKGSNPLVKRFGGRLFPWACRDVPRVRDREEVERLEAELAEALKARGWGVWYNADSLSKRLGGRSEE